MLSFIPRQLYPWRKSTHYPLNWRLDGPVLLWMLRRSCSRYIDYGTVSFRRLRFGTPDSQTKSRSPNLTLPFGHELREESSESGGLNGVLITHRYYVCRKANFFDNSGSWGEIFEKSYARCSRYKNEEQTREIRLHGQCDP